MRPSTVTAADFHLVRTVVRDSAAIVLEDGKEYLVESRLLPVARGRGHESVSDLLGELRREPTGPLRTVVVEALTTNETSFFRDNHPFQALNERVLPELVERRVAERSLTVWSAACASGQEPYSVAMLLHEQLAGRAGWSARIIATDISAAMLARTSAGLYSQLEVNRGLPVSRLMQHFSRAGAGWEASAELRSMVETRQLNLAGQWPALPMMDVILMRNVLIYFDVSTKQRVLHRVRSLLKPDGYLILGGAETTLNLDPAYERVPLGATAAYRLREGGGAS